MTANNTPDPNEKINPPEPVFTVLKNKGVCPEGQVAAWQMAGYTSRQECADSYTNSGYPEFIATGCDDCFSF